MRRLASHHRNIRDRHPLRHPPALARLRRHKVGGVRCRRRVMHGPGASAFNQAGLAARIQGVRATTDVETKILRPRVRLALKLAS
jgi:hypothetical protein